MKKTRKPPAPQPLAGYWMPPPDAGAPVACLASTYTFHAALFEDDLLPRFLGLRFDNTEKERIFIAEREDKLSTVTAAVFVDVARVDGRQTTGRWSQIPVPVPGGCQHSKVTLLVWEEHIRVLIGSANLTTTGYRRNREMAACLDFHGKDGTSPKHLLSDVLDFLEDDLLALGTMPPGTRARLADAIKNTRQRVREWQLPDAPAGLPATRFIPVSPKRPGRAARGVMDPLLAAWGSKSASSISVVTPFVGDSEKAAATTMAALMRLPRARGAEGRLVLGGRLGDDGKCCLDVPDWFRDAWAKMWKLEAHELPVYVPPRSREDEKVDRALHAKAVLIQSDDRTLLLMGSSNLSPHGLGLGTYNLEANLCYVARELDHTRALQNALPVDWDDDLQDDLRWPAQPEPIEDERPPTAPAPPPAFQWATFDETSGVLSVQVDSAAKLPSSWSIWIPDYPHALLESTQAPPLSPDTPLSVKLDAAARARRITHVTIRWRDDTDQEQEATLPTLVDREAELLPPEALRSLRSDDIVQCLLSGKDPIEWANEGGDDPDSAAPPPKKGGKDLDLLRTLDTDAYVIYRTRRLGRALTALSQRLLDTLRTPTAIRHRLERDPVGPLMLARALEAEAKDAGDVARDATVFALAELTLALAHVAVIIDPKGKLGLRPLFDDVRRQIDEVASHVTTDVASTGPLRRYVSAARERCAAKSAEGIHAG